MVKSLPQKPNLEHLKNQAKQLLKSHKHGDLTVCETLCLLHRFADLTPQEILAAKVSLKDVQFALALSYGFKGWERLTQHVESTQTSKGNARITNSDINRFTDHLIMRLREEAKNQRGGRNIKVLRSAFHDHSSWVAANENRAFTGALQRIDDGTFGICDECGGNIPTELLKDIPDESLCIKCASGGKVNTPESLYCDFCGKNAKRVKTLIAGAAVYICDECLQVCSEVLSESKEGKLPPGSDSAMYCSFCGKAQTTLIAGSGIYICDQCVHLCSEIVGKDTKSEDSQRGGERRREAGNTAGHDSADSDGDEVAAIFQRAQIQTGGGHMTDDPWETVNAMFEVGDVVTGHITHVTDFGIFVGLAEGIEGLVHVSEISKEKTPTTVGQFSVSDSVTVKVMNINKSERRIGLSIKRLTDDDGPQIPKPWMVN